MSSKPKRQQYAASQAEKTQAGVSLAEYNRFKKTYDPVLKEWRDEAGKDYAPMLRSRAGADVQQSATGKMPGLSAVESVSSAADRASLGTSAMLAGTLQAKDISTNMASDVLAASRGQQAQTMSGLSIAARLGAKGVIEESRNRMMVSGARMGALGQIAGTAGSIPLYNKMYGKTPGGP